MSSEFIQGEIRGLPKRGITEDTARKYGYQVGVNRAGRHVQIASYRGEDGAVVAQHTRTAEKDFAWVGEAKLAGLFGQHTARGEGRRIVVSEGELDAMSISQAFGNTWDVVSVPNGAQGAKKAVQRALEFLEGYDLVVLWFDGDAPGQEATAECAPLFTPGKCAVAVSTRKDANEALLLDGTKAVTVSVYNAKPYRPGGVVNGSELWERMTATQTAGIPYPWPGLTAMTGGLKFGTLTTWTSGTGMGKSTAVAQVAYDLAFPSDGREPLTVGYVALEEDVGRAAQRFVSHRLGKLVHMPGQATEDELRVAFDATMGTGRVWLLDHFGSTDSEGLVAKLRYLAKGCSCRVLVLDHLSIAISGADLGSDERRNIDWLMTKLRTLTEETGVIFLLVSHLKRGSDEKGPEEGSRVSLSMLRGSQSIAQLSDVVIGLERNLQAPEGSRDMSARILKNRTTGETGVACVLAYNKMTGQLVEVPPERSEFTKDETCDLPF